MTKEMQEKIERDAQKWAGSGEGGIDRYADMIARRNSYRAGANSNALQIEKLVAQLNRIISIIEHDELMFPEFPPLKEAKQALSEHSEWLKT